MTSSSGRNSKRSFWSRSSRNKPRRLSRTKKCLGLGIRNETLRRTVASNEADCAASSALEARERADKIRAAIDRLPSRYRELLLLKVQEEKSYREIAQITGHTVTNVGFLLHRAMKELSLRLTPSKEVL